MKTNLIKKYIAFFSGTIYILSYFLQSFFFFDFNKVYAENQLEYTNLIAVLVDDQIYNDLEDEIKRYTQKYIQGGSSDTRYNAISNSKAIVLPIDINSLEAKDIAKILENMYFDGISGEPSKLVGTVLIGDIPLPVINQDGYIYPSIYPYVDFEKQKFIWNENTNYFVYNDNPYGQSEIRHGIINFDKVSEYQKYFDKLQIYAKKPSEFIGKNIWYDDLIANKQYFYKEALNSYMNGFIFAEDIGYRRYTDLMVKLMQESHNNMISDLLSDFDGIEELQNTTNEMNTPTMSLETMVKNGYIKSYSSLIAGKQLDNIVKNVETANRWIESYSGTDGNSKTRTALDTHYLKIEQKDETSLRMNGGLEPIIISFNEVLENIVNKKIEEEKYRLNEVIPLTYLKYNGEKKFNGTKFICTREDYEVYKNYFFGLEADRIDSMQQISAYRGTYRNYDNIDNLTIQNIQDSKQPSSDIGYTVSLNNKSIGGSYDIFATQVEANRGYNISNTIRELEIYELNKIAKREYWNTKCDKKFLGICWKKRRREADTAPIENLCNPLNDEEVAGCETPAEFGVRNRGGASPLNLSGMDNWTSGYNFQDAIYPIYDIAGSKSIISPEYEANSFEGISKYTRLIQTKFVPDEKKYWNKNKKEKAPDKYAKGYNDDMGEDVKFTNWIPLGDLDNPNRGYNPPKLAKDIDYFEKYNDNTNWEGNIIKIKKEINNDCVGEGEIFTYKTLDSRLKNNLSTEFEIGGTNYKVFQDEKSPVKRLYDGVLTKIQSTDDLVQYWAENLNINTQNGVLYNINKLGDNVENIKSSINEILNYNISSISSLSTQERQTIGEQRKEAFNAQDVNKINNNIEKIKEQLLDLDGFADSFSFNYIQDYINDQIYVFEINQRNLILLNTRKQNILSQLTQIKNKFNSIANMINTLENEYNNVGELNKTYLESQLITKKGLIDTSITNSSGTIDLGCNNYPELCSAIDFVKNNLTNNAQQINDNINEITNFDFEDFNLDGVSLGLFGFQPFNSIKTKFIGSSLSNEYQKIYNQISLINESSNTELEEGIPGMNQTTSDRPIDSPKYISFKGIGGDLVKFIYPNLYKTEVFSGSSSVLNLKSPNEIEQAIKINLKETVKKYNQYLIEQKNKKNIFYNTNSDAFDKLGQGDPLANPDNVNNSDRPYNLIPEDYLINELEDKLKDNIFFANQMGGYEPIEFISHMIYYQNIGWEQKEVGKTIKEDINNNRTVFDINSRIKHIVNNYLIKDNNRGNFITPGYRDNGYEVAFVNSDGADYITHKDDPVFVQKIKSATANYSTQTPPQIEQTQLEEELQNDCNIPEDGGVLLFDLSEGESPWLKALRCWREKVRDKPFEFEFDRSSVQGPAFNLGNNTFFDGTGTLSDIGNTSLNILGADEIQSQYINQLGLLDTDDDNQEILDNSNPGDYQKLEQIVSYTKLEIENQNINADEAKGEINISAGVELSDVEFYIKNVGNSIFKLNGISENITEGTTGYQTGITMFDPFETKNLEFEITEPVDGTNVLVFHMCLPGTQDINNCVKKTIRINVIPGKLETIEVNIPGNKILEGSKLPIIVKGEDQFGNNVGNLLTERFEISVNNGSLSYQSNKSNKVTFSDFSKSDFVLNADDGVKDGDKIRIDIRDKDGSRAFVGNSIIKVVKGYIDVQQNETSINNISVSLPNNNDYSYKDSFDITQSNLNTIPKIVLELKDNNNNKINIENVVNIKTKNGLLKPGNIETRSITKSMDGMTFDITQNRFKQENNHIVSGGQLIVYLMPNFDAGEDTIYISMPGIDEIQIPVIVNPADASVIEITSKKDFISTESNTKANLKITDIWGNIITNDTMLKLGVIGPVEISGFDNSSQIISVEKGNLNFEINSKNKGGEGFVYGIINDLALDKQKPGNKTIVVQEKILPEKNLNIMYLNLFGSDWGNQWGYMSENNKYVQNLITNSDKLLTTTTQLISPENIKRFTTIVNPKLQISNIDELNIDLELDENILINVGEIGIVNVNIDELKIQEVDVSEDNQELVIQDLIEDKYEDENVLIYLPEGTDSIVTSNETDNDVIFINGENVFDLNTMESDGKLEVTLSNNEILGYQIWELKLDEKLVGKVMIVINDKNSVDKELSTQDPKYDFDEVWLNGSTNKEGIGFYETDSNLPDDTIGYESIQDSIDPELSIGFRHDFKNVTNFGAGESVGEATLPFSSEFLINIGDPLLKRVDENKNAVIYDENEEKIDTGFDKGLGEVIYSEPGKTIFKVKNIDFNNDGLEDIIVSFTDGTIKILKNYGGNTPFKKLGDLMILSDGIKDIIIGDVDGNDYEDIIIWSKSDTLRVYKNNEGVFDVDGYPICINTNVKDGMISEEPQNIGGVFQIFFEDMDKDGSLDIVTNDKFGYIKIFYGGENNPRNEDNYVSSDKYKCDDNWYGKQSYGDNTNMVYRFGIRVNENVKVLDQSLVHWLGINPEKDINVDSEDLGIDTYVFNEENLSEDNLDEILGNAMGFDINAGIQQYKSIERYKQANFKTIPIYENLNNENQVEYVEMGCLTGSDPVKVYKKYKDLNGDVLENGDTVQISVNIKANEDFVGTFIDRITGPWKISLLENDMMEYFWFDTGSISEYQIENELKFHRDMINSRYMMDNIRLSAGEELKFNYRVTYDGDVQTSKIEIKDIEGNDYHEFGTSEGNTLDDFQKDEYPDIKVKPNNGCNKSMFMLFNEDQNKSYIPKYIDLTELMLDYSTNAQENFDNAMSSVTNTLLDNSNPTDGGLDFGEIPGMDSITESWKNLDMFSETFSMESLISNGGVDLSEMINVPMELMDGLLGDVMDKVDGLMGDMCKGFDLSDYGVSDSNNCGLPIPFNQSFLGPGNYHLFGCFDLPPITETIGKGLPVLTIPGNWPSPAGYIPAPGIFGLPFKGPTDGFLGVAGGSFDSQFRLYVVPTLTAEIGIAMCFGPHKVGTAIPDPAASIGGNCIVTSVPLPCKDTGSLGPNASNEIPEAYLDLEACSNQNIPCYVQDGESTSSLEMVSASSDNLNMTTAVPDGSFAGGFINIEKNPITTYGYKTPESGIEINGVKLKGGADAKNKILGSNAQGLIKSLSKNRMDKQINYIFSNLTNFKVDVYWPDFGEIFGNMGSISKALEKDKETSGKEKCENRGMERKIEGDNGICIKKSNPNQNEQALSDIDAWSQENLISRGQVSNRSDAAFANPFEKMETMFEEVPLINLRTENINVKIPMISSEDITAYISMSKNWINKQQKVLEERTSFFAAMIGWCGGDKNINNFSDLKVAFDDMKKEMKEIKENEIKSIENQKNTKNEVESIENKIKVIKDLSKKYDLKDLGTYEIFEACDGNNFFIKVDTSANTNQILPYDIYLLYNPGNIQEITMFTKGFDLIKNNSGNKTKISYQKNLENIKNSDVCFKSFVSTKNNQCVDLFLGGKLEVMLDSFINIQTNTNQLIKSVQQNIETLELYKKFPLDLYERIHVGDRYLSEISSVVNNFLGTLSLWMKTNATRYSQYVDSFILMMTTIQTYQAIIDLSVDWSQKCSSCTNDNYDQFACKLGLLCPDNLPILEIPPMKIPSIYIDLSNINMATDVKLPKFNFVPTSVPLPSLPNIPSPPSIDAGLDIEQSAEMGIDMIGQLIVNLEKFDISMTLPSVPTIPAPPDLPELPSFVPSVKMELPLLPPAPKIPKLPNEINTAITTAETIGQIMCIVKGDIGLVGEDSIKAKIEQMSQRTYEVPYRDNMDQTLSERNNQSNSKIPNRIKDTFAFLKSNEFEDVDLKGFDIGVESYVNLQYNFAGFYDFVDQVVKEVNSFSSMPGDYMQEVANNGNYYSKILENKMSVCVNNPLSTACMGDDYIGEIKETNEYAQEIENKILQMKTNIKNGFNGIKEAMQLIAQKETEKENLEIKTKIIEENIEKMNENIDSLKADLKITTDENRKKILLYDLEALENKLYEYIKQTKEYKNQMNELDKEIIKFNKQYGKTIETYEEYLSSYGKLNQEYEKLKIKLSERSKKALDTVNEGIEGVEDMVDGQIKFDKMNEWNQEIQEKMDTFEQEQETKRKQREFNLDNMYKEIETISYVDYDSKLYEKNLNKLKDGLEKIKNKTENKSFKKQIDNYIKLANINNDVSPANDNLEKVKGQYSNTVNSIKNQNNNILEKISYNYDKFLEDVKGNKVSLVSKNIEEIALSTKLFDINNDSLDIIKSQENINKKYLEYYSKNINGYLNTINVHDAEDLNMSQEIYDANKKYLSELKEKTKIAYNAIEGKTLIAQSSSSSVGLSDNAGSFTDISSYIDGKVIKTPEGSIDLANNDYVSKFQGKTLMTDMNNDKQNDLILWDENNVYIKYRNNQNNYENTDYDDDYYMYKISSYRNLLENSEEGFVKIKNIYVKLGDQNREVKNFEYHGGDFDNIKLSWKNSFALGDKPKGYLIKMIHRVDLFNDKEIIISNNNKKLFDKKYVLILPKGSTITGTKISLEEGTYRIENILSGLIFDVVYYNENQENINLTIQDIPRNWQYSEIYTLETYQENLYYINNSSSNQIVSGPQILADTKGPEPTISLYRPATNTTIGTGEKFDSYVSTNYILQGNRKDNVGIKKMWIADSDGNNIVTIEDVSEKTGYIELDDLFFTGATSINYYFGATDINNNSSVTQVNLSVKTPNIEIVDIQKYGNEIENIGSPATVTAEIDHDLDEGYVQFHRYRNDLWQIMTGTLGGIEIDKYSLEPYQTIITGGFYDFGDDIGLYLPSGELAIKINPDNGKIEVLDGYNNQINIQLDYSTKTPTIKITETNGNLLFMIALPAEELIEITAETLEIQNLNKEIFGDFQGGKAIIDGDQVLVYVGPNGEIYTEVELYGEYSFDEENESVIYSFRKTQGGENLGTIELKIKNMLEY